MCPIENDRRVFPKCLFLALEESFLPVRTLPPSPRPKKEPLRHSPNGPCNEIRVFLGPTVPRKDFGAQVYNSKVHGPLWLYRAPIVPLQQLGRICRGRLLKQTSRNAGLRGCCQLSPGFLPLPHAGLQRHLHRRRLSRAASMAAVRL